MNLSQIIAAIQKLPFLNLINFICHVLTIRLIVIMMSLWWKFSITSCHKYHWFCANLGNFRKGAHKSFGDDFQKGAHKSFGDDRQFFLGQGGGGIISDPNPLESYRTPIMCSIIGRLATLRCRLGSNHVITLTLFAKLTNWRIICIIITLTVMQLPVDHKTNGDVSTIIISSMSIWGKACCGIMV